MKKRSIITILSAAAAVLVLSSCSGVSDDTKPMQDTTVQQTEAASQGVYLNIDAQQAKQIMDSESDYIILDVRTQEEFAQQHIPGAILIPDYEITSRAEKELTDKNQLILVYCRSGRRSKLAAEALVELGYTNIYEFGGIIDWPYETTR